MPALTLTTTKTTRKRARRLPTPAQSEVTATLSLIARTWRLLTPQQRQNWNALGQQWSPNPKKTTAPGMTVFISLNSVRLLTGQTEILRDAPSQPAPPAPLPPVHITAAYPDTATLRPGTLENDFILTLHAAPYDGPVRICATRPLSAGITTYRPQDFIQIGILPAITTPATDLSALYLASRQAPAPGMQIALMLCPLTDTGFKGQHVCAPAHIPLPASPLHLSRD